MGDKGLQIGAIHRVALHGAKKPLAQRILLFHGVLHGNLPDLSCRISGPQEGRDII